MVRKMINTAKGHKKFVKGLLVLKKVFDNHKIVFWLEAGTLIGAAREGKIIPWDSDVDISYWIDSTPNIYKTNEDFKKYGYELYFTGGHYALRDIKTKKHLICILPAANLDNYIAKMSFLIPYRYFIWALSEPDYSSYDYDFNDYFSKYIPKSIKKIIVTGTSKFNGDERLKLVDFFWKLILKFKLYSPMFVRSPKEYLGNFTEIEFYGEKFRIPENYDQYLEFRFNNWKIPDKNGRGKTRSLKEIKVGA